MVKRGCSDSELHLACGVEMEMKMAVAMAWCVGGFDAMHSLG